MIAFRRKQRVEAGDHLPPVPDAETALAQCDRLVRAGRRMEAIELLTSANRSSRDARLEQRLVQLRHRAFDDLIRAPANDEWPPDVPDLFADVQGIPEVAASQLSGFTLRSGILRHGCLLVRGLVPPARIELLKSDIDKALEACAAHATGAPVGETAPWYVPFIAAPHYSVGDARLFVNNGGGVWTVDSPRTMFDVLETFDEIGLAGPVTDYLGERPALSVKKWTLRRVPVDSNTNWHQDGAFLGQGIRTVNAWITLSHCGDTAPGLDVVPRRLDEIVETGTEGALFDWSVGDRVVERMVTTSPVLRPVFEPGDALFFDEMNLHRTGVSPGMQHERYAIESWFFAPSCYPSDQAPVVF
jgi:hypothetical protein